jgi:hypothetical protein
LTLLELEDDTECNVTNVNRYCYDLNFAANRKFKKVRERSRTGSRTPTSGTGRDEFAREGAKGIKGGTDAI